MFPRALASAVCNIHPHLKLLLTQVRYMGVQVAQINSISGHHSTDSVLFSD